MIVLFTINIVVATMKHGNYQGKWNAGGTLIAVLIEIGILYCGGFFSQP
jgi:hypothetical protein